MKKRTHLLFAALLFFLLIGFFGFPLAFVIFALVGAMVPDIDFFFMKMHRKILHNIWVLIAMVFAGLQFSIFNNSIAIAFSIGFLSHLIADSLTPMGIKPLWPIQVPHFKGPIRTGSAIEFVLALVLLFAIGWAMGLVEMRLLL